MKIFNNLYQLDASAIIKNVFIIGDWNNINHITLRNQINIICDNCVMTNIKQNGALSPNNFDLFVNSIQLNLIGFNLPSKNKNGTDKEDNEDDRSDDFIVYFTTIYNRSSTYTFVIYQYGGREDDILAAIDMIHH